MDIVIDLLKVGVVFAFLILGSRRMGMAVALGAGVLAFALLSGLGVDSYVRVTQKVFTGSAFWYLEIMMLGLLTFAEIFVQTGLCDRMVRGLETYITSPRGRLVVFPFIMALLPVPGGAILSCPMVESAAKNMQGLNPVRLAVINYWFRHCLEAVWPLYPGYAMVCVMAQIDFTVLPLYTSPLVLFSWLAGWVFLLRGIRLAESAAPHADKSPREVLLGGMPLLVTIGTALLSVAVGALSGIRFFSDWAFVLAPCAGILCCLMMTHASWKFLWTCVRSPRVTQILALMVSIFYFKEFLEESDFITPFVTLTQSYGLLPLVFAIVPIISGMAVGLYSGFVALSFPLLIPMLQVTPELWDSRFAYVALAVIFGQMGQLLSPTHTCFMFSCGYFNASLGRVWERLLLPVSLVLVLGVGWFLILLRQYQ